MNSPDLAQRADAVLTPALIDAFARDGAVCLRGLLSPDEVALLRRGIDANIAAPSPRAKVASRPDDLASSSRTSAAGRTTRPIGASSSTRPWPRPPRA